MIKAISEKYPDVYKFLSDMYNVIINPNTDAEKKVADAEKEVAKIKADLDKTEADLKTAETQIRRTGGNDQPRCLYRDPQRRFPFPYRRFRGGGHQQTGKPAGSE